MLKAFKALGMAKQLIAVGVALVVLFGGWEMYKHSLRSEGRAQLSNELKANDDKTLKEKAQNDADLRSKNIDDLIREFDTDSVPD